MFSFLSVWGRNRRKFKGKRMRIILDNIDTEGVWLAGAKLILERGRVNDSCLGILQSCKVVSHVKPGITVH